MTLRPERSSIVVVEHQADPGRRRVPGAVVLFLDARKGGRDRLGSEPAVEIGHDRDGGLVLDGPEPALGRGHTDSVEGSGSRCCDLFHGQESLLTVDGDG